MFIEPGRSTGLALVIFIQSLAGLLFPVWPRSSARSLLRRRGAAAAAAPRLTGSPAYRQLPTVTRFACAARCRPAPCGASLSSFSWPAPAAVAARARPTRKSCNCCGARFEIEMDMLLVIAVGAGSEHGREARADAGSDRLAPILADMDVGQVEFVAVGELEIAHVERVGAAVLAQLRGAHIIAAAAVIGGEIVERAQRRQILQDGTTSSRTHCAISSAIGQRNVAAGSHRDFALIGQDHGIHQHGIGGAAFAGADQRSAAAGMSRSWPAAPGRLTALPRAAAAAVSGIDA